MARHGSRVRQHRPRVRRVRQAGQRVERQRVRHTDEGVPHPRQEDEQGHGHLGVRHETVRDDGAHEAARVQVAPDGRPGGNVATHKRGVTTTGGMPLYT